MEVERAADIFETFVYKYSAKSLALKRTFDINFDYEKKEVEVKYTGKDEVIERRELPEKLKYTTIYLSLIHI